MDSPGQATVWVSGVVMLAVGLTLSVAVSEASEATLVVATDAPCILFVDDEFVFRIEAGQPRQVVVASGSHDLVALSVEARDVRWEDDVSVRGGDEEPVEIAIAAEVEDAVEDAPRARFGDDPSRLELADNGVLGDPETALEWTPQDIAFDADWETAARYCSTLELGADADRPWRLPTVEELSALVDDEAAGDYQVLRPVRLTGCCCWSSEDHGRVSAWYMDFTSGERGFVARSFTEGARVLCVR